MLKILHRYTLREIALPSILSSSALVFIMLIAAKAPWENQERLIVTLAKLFFRPGIERSDVLLVLLLGIPSMLIFIVPMALLIGIIIGVGRMTLDLEIRAIQTGGVNLAVIFIPVFMVGLALSAVTAWLGYGAEPRMLKESIQRGGKLLISEFTNLEPGRIYQGLFGQKSGLNLYFEGRTPEGAMRGVTLTVDPGAFENDDKNDKAKARVKAVKAEIEKKFKAGKIKKEERDRLIYEAGLDKKTEQPALIVAREAQFALAPSGTEIELNLADGAVHMLTPKSGPSAPEEKPDAETGKEEKAKPTAEPKTKGEAPKEGANGESKRAEGKGADKTKGAASDYAIVHFEQMQKTESVNPPDERKTTVLMSVPELVAAWKNKENKDKKRRQFYAAILERFSRSFQCLAFAFIGVPLAIWIRPTGKSIGILLAAAVIFLYHFALRMGVNTVTETSHATLGTAMIFSPNLFLAAAGAWLWRRTLRS